MDRETFRDLVGDRVLLLDGATGSNLLKAGMPAGICAESWILEHPGAILELQRAYVDAGSQILFAPTFSANAIALKERQEKIPVEEMNRRLVDLSRRAAGGRALVAADMTMTGKQLLPTGSLAFEQLVDCYGEQAAALRDAGVELFVVETMISLQEMRAAVLAIRQCCDLPILASFTVDENGYTFLGTEITAAAVTLERMGVDAVGVNCSMGPEQMLPVVEKLQRVTMLPVIAKANAGSPRQEGDTVVYPMDAQQYAVHAGNLADAGVRLLGGCCGTTPDFLRGMKEMLVKKGLYIPLDRKGAKAGDPARCGRGLSHGTEKRGAGLASVGYLATDRCLFDPDRITSLSYAGCPAENPELARSLAQGEYEDAVDALGEPEEGRLLYVDLDGVAAEQPHNIPESFVAQIAASGIPVCFGASALSLLEQALRFYCGVAAARISGLSDCEAARRTLAKYGAVEYEAWKKG